MTPVMVAAAAGHELVIERLLQASADVQARSSYGNTALHFGAAKGHLLACKTLLHAGADIGACDLYGITPLMDATKGGHLLLFHQLVAKANITAQQRNGYTVMRVAASAGAVRAIERLLRIQGGGQSLLEMGDVKPLMAAVIDDQASAAEILLENGANVNATASDGTTALHVAAQCGYVELCHLLLDGGASVEAKSLAGETPLQVAESRDHSDGAECLAQKLMEQAASCLPE